VRVNEALVGEVTGARFTTVTTRGGYDMGDVDAFLDRICPRLYAGEPVADMVAKARFTPTELRQGYDVREVDRFLDHVVATAGVADAAARNPNPTTREQPVVTGRTEPTFQQDPTVDPQWVNPVAEVRSPLARLFGRRRR